MSERIEKLTQMSLSGNMYVHPVTTEFDRMDLFLSKQKREVKRICEFIANQEPLITEYSALTGFFHFDESVVGDAFNRIGHPATDECIRLFYLQKVQNLSSMDWQHATSDYRRVLEKGLVGIIEDIDVSLAQHQAEEEVEFLTGLKDIAHALIGWAKKCSDRAAEFAKTVEQEEYRANLERLSKALLRVPKYAPGSFYEAVLSIYVCFSANPDSFGTLDRYLTPFYEQDLATGAITREEAKELLQEMYLMVQAVTPISSDAFTKGGQSHFCIGGRDIDGKDCFNSTSRLIVESMMELPIYIPQVTLRWTNDTPRDVLRFMLDAERNDPMKRISVTNDDKRIKAHMHICGFPYEEAINYTLVGCNEPAMLGGMSANNSHGNLAHSVEALFHEQAKQVCEASTFEQFHEMFKASLYRDLDIIYHYDDLYNLERAKDINYVSSLFFNGCIENAKSMTRGGVNYAISCIMFLGTVNVIDSLAIVKQFIYDEKLVTMEELVRALQADWQGYEELRTAILKRGKFFGNDDETSNYVAKLFYDDMYEYVKTKKTVFGYPVLLGDHTGYNEHFKWFGQDTKATPDGRYAGEPLHYGLSQSGGKDRNDLTALLNAISKFDVQGLSGATVTNLSLDEHLIRQDEYFEKTVDLLETYLRNGGMQFQLNYVSREELLEAQACPEKHRSLRVRVTGYSEYFNNLARTTQDSIVERTVKE